jgi:hypothetical protein
VSGGIGEISLAAGTTATKRLPSDAARVSANR